MRWVDINKGDLVTVKQDYTTISNTKVIKGATYVVFDKSYDNNKNENIYIRDAFSGNHVGYVPTDMLTSINPQKSGGRMENLKAYFKKHSETFITLGIVILIDEYLFGGALREKIKALLDKILGQTVKRLEVKDE